MAAELSDTCTAIVVGTPDSPYLPRTLLALARQSRPAQQVVLAVLDDEATNETATSPRVARLLSESGLGPDRPQHVAPGGVYVIGVPAGHGFGDAARVALARAGAKESDWLWLLHDDSAPDDSALAHLTDAVEDSPLVQVAGVKQVDWDEPDRLISVGVAMTTTWQRHTGIEDGEIDQGQHDGREDVYAVGTAGMLIRQRMWQRLRGPDPALGVFYDGADISRRARLAGGRVVVVPRARVRHARAGLAGIRTRASARGAGMVEPDPRRSFAARRTAQLHSWLVRTPLPALPLVWLAILVLAPLRAIGRVTTNELGLAGAELRAALTAALRGGAITRARRRARRTAAIPRRRLAPLQATTGEVWQARRNRRRQAVAQQRAAQAPSELEIRERAAVARRRRLTFGALAVLTLGAALLALAPLVASGPLIGGALRPADTSLAHWWQSALGGWITTGDGYSGPPDPFLTVLGVLAVLTGGPFGVPAQAAISALLLAAIPLAATTAWFAAGAATRSVLLRAWAAGVWAFGPPLLAALHQGRLGALLAHVLLPLVALGVVRALGLDKRDVVISGMVGAKRVARRSPAASWRSARQAKQARLAALAAVGNDEREDVFADLEPIRSNTADDDRTDDDEEGPQERATSVSRTSRAPSLAAAAGAGLALTVVVAGAPVLLPAVLLALIVLAVGLGRGPAHRPRLIAVALPAVVFMGPIWLHAINTWAAGGWRVLLADPGVPAPSDPGPAWLTLLSWPTEPGTGGTGLFSDLAPLAATGVVIVAAVVALLRRGARGRVVRIGWLLGAIGLATALISSRTVVGLGPAAEEAGRDELVTGWAGAGTSVMLLGFLVATAIAMDALPGALAGRTFGWRQIGAAVLSALLVLALVVSAVSWTAAHLAQEEADRPALTARGVDPVPALGLTLQEGQTQARVLALAATEQGVDAHLWRGNGPQLVETATAVSLSRALAHLGPGDDGEGVDGADAHLMSVVADMTTGSALDVADRLRQHAIAVVIVPEADSAVTGAADEAGRARLISALDAVAGLERVTENPTGVVWRVATEPDQGPIMRGQIRDDQGQEVIGVRFEHDSGAAQLPSHGSGRTLVLAERAAPGWRAEVDGRSLRAIEDGWRQAFEVPDGAAGELQVSYRPAIHLPWQILTAVVLGLTVLLALPTRRRRMLPASRPASSQRAEPEPAASTSATERRR